MMKATLTDAGLHIDIVMPPKKFKTGKNGFFKQAVVDVDGKKYRLNLMAYEDKTKK